MAASRSKSTPHTPAGWSARRRAVVSVLVALHLLAVFVGPFAVAPRSQLGQSLRVWLRPYLEVNDLDHGYRFFDEPGPSHRIAYEISFADGRPVEAGIFPDRDVHWPRLFYHRHFMLTENHYGMDAPPQPPRVPANSDIYRAWQVDRQLYDELTRSYAQQLLAKHGGESVKLFGVERGLPLREDVLKGVAIDDSRYLRPRASLGEFRREED